MPQCVLFVCPKRGYFGREKRERGEYLAMKNCGDSFYERGKRSMRGGEEEERRELLACLLPISRFYPFFVCPCHENSLFRGCKVCKRDYD
ncbi:unnamed protein product [Sphenostylis stenocarpa]|uniref:Uncharacterized protein n=1 Tax=Sphenostylis stenocarpa TaxID=92480 RepID=A0AA86W5Y1_9FABA|nr:unnamed protein product [Sphenostylis stenocarpa]